MLVLISHSYETDAILQRIPVETSREIFAKVKSVSFIEWNEAGKRGMKPQWRAEIFSFDYSGEILAEYQGVRYSIYRTYQPNEDTLELYLEARAGDER